MSEDGDAPPSSDEVQVAVSYQKPSPKRQRSVSAIVALALAVVFVAAGAGSLAGGAAKHPVQPRAPVGQPMSLVAASGAKLDQDDDTHDPGELHENALR